MLKTVKEGDFPGLFDVLGEEGASQEDLMAVGEQFFVALYGQPSGSSMTQARYNLYTRKQGKPMRIMSLPTFTMVTPSSLRISCCTRKSKTLISP